MAASPLPSWVPKRGWKYHDTAAFLGMHKPRGTKSEVATSPSPSWGAKRERKCYDATAIVVVTVATGTRCTSYGLTGPLDAEQSPSRPGTSY